MNYYFSYADINGKTYGVRKGISGLYAACRLNKKSYYTKVKSSKILWRDTPDQAERDLGEYAARKGWMLIGHNETLDKM